MPETRFAVEVLRMDAAGNLVPLKEPVFPSLPSPQVTVETFEIRNIRKAPNGVSYVCDLRVAGTVASALCDLLPGSDGGIEKGELFLNGSDKPHAPFEIKVQKTDVKSTSDLRRPFAFSGRFDTTVAALPITEGNNTFRLVAADKVYGLAGFALWAASFRLPFEPEPGEEPAPDAPKTPSLEAEPKQVAGGTGGELHLYALSISGVNASEAETLRIYLGNEAPLACGLIPAAAGGTYLAKRPDADVPLLFSLRPTDREKGFEPDDAMVMALFSKRLGVSSLSERGAFLLGLSTGLFAVGGDLVAGADAQAATAVSFSDLRGALVLAGHISKDTHPLQDFEVLLPAQFAEPATPAAGEMDSPAILWHFANLFRTKDPRAEAVVLSILTGDFSDVGLESVKLEDWREDFYQTMAELLEEMIKSNVHRSPADHGYVVGRCLSEALRITLIPGRAGRIEEFDKAKFLKKLGEVHFFGGRFSGGKPMRKPVSTLEALRRFLFGK